ncbi:hypothetical protein MRB53_002910 [Persea americana]|uniref:Uncharacterized protein n=1 Tax=Persea americana TaxID=3435 RepID=A0ACC2MVQ4_PERAE|nr:hypothetical protein MRB53_002910 [Persea americana]
MTTMESGDQLPLGLKPPSHRRYCTWRRCAAASAILLLFIFLLVLILALTVFKAKDPTTTLSSISVSGVSPRVSIPALNVQLNVSLDLIILVQNPNRASFTYGHGKSFVFYRQTQVGEADLPPGRVPSMGSERIGCRLTIQTEKFVSDLGPFIGDVMSGEVGLNATMRIPGKVTVLRVFKRHAVAVVQCHVAIGFPNLRIRGRECQHRTEM